ncbi:MFS domain-containing protein [Haematococcus lacustris]|uniref:MFS domain-containing protein n=1 Tax=Haematococcus lacustris TaxID=44745 RepID=A0A699ZL12_HAELA|nr:MFS domain-containing protein [Haematococcus lacustris]
MDVLRVELASLGGFVASAGALMLMPAAQGVNMGVAASTLTLGALGFSRGGFSVNHMDIAPKYAGMVMGISNTAGKPIASIAFHPSGHLLVVASGHKVYVWPYQAGLDSQPSVLLKTRRSLRALHFHPAGSGGS